MSFSAFEISFKNAKSVGPLDQLVLFWLARHHNHERNLCFPSHKLLAEETGLGESTVRRSINNLVAAGIIEKQASFHKSGRQTSCNYKFIHMHQKDGVGATIWQDEVPQHGTLQSRKKESKDSSSLELDDPVILIFDTYEEKPNTEDKYFWDEAVGMLMAMGVANVTSRTFVGKCLKLANGDKDEILRILQVAVNKNVRDPIAYLSAALGGKQSKEKVTKNQQIAEAFAELEAASERKKAQWAKEYELDDIGGVREEDHVQLQPKQPDRSSDIPQKRGRGLRKVSTRRVAQIVGPVIRDINESQVSSNDF